MLCLWLDKQEDSSFDMNLRILQKNEHFIIIDKEHDIVINSNDSSRASIHKQLCATFPFSINSQLKFGFYFPHRLDYSTSGILCIALSKEACAAASASFQSRESKKYYVALLRGHVSPTKLQVEVPLGFETLSTDPPQKMIANGLKARDAVTRMIVLERGSYASDPATKILLKPLTGRRHQLRVHCQFIGHTIIGDYTYSNKEDTTPPRMCLHALRLALPNNLTPVDVMTKDPFSTDLCKSWRPSEILHSVDDERTMETLDNGDPTFFTPISSHTSSMTLTENTEILRP